jgi:hypothetical protein
VSEAAVRVERQYRYVHQDVDRWGNVRVFFRRRVGERKIRIREAIGTPEFDRRHEELLRQAEAGAFKPEPSTGPKPRTMRWLGVEWVGSAQFARLDPRTQHVTQLILDAMYVEPIAPSSTEIFGDWPLDHFGAKAVRILRDRKAAAPEGANNRVRRLRAMFKWAMKLENEDLGIKVNPALAVEFLTPKRAGGFPVWAPADIDKFEARHPIGTTPRLALALLCFTGARRSDVVQLGRQHVREGRFVFRQHKGRNRTPVTIDIPVLPVLRSIIDATPTVGALTFLMNQKGRPFTANGFGGWFRDRCDEAGVYGGTSRFVR